MVRELSLTEEIYNLPIESATRDRLLAKLDQELRNTECKVAESLLNEPRDTDLAKQNRLLLEQSDSLRMAFAELSKALFLERGIKRTRV